MTRLPNDEIQLLIAAHKITAKRNNADKIKCIIYWGRGYSWEQIKELLFISDGTIKNYIDMYQSGGIEKLLQCNHSGNNSKLNAEQEKTLENYVEKYNVLTSKQAVKYVYDKFGIDFTSNGMTKTLIRLGFSYKKPKRAPCKIDSLAEASFLFNYICRTVDLPSDESVYFMDAAGFVHNSKIDYGWIKKGKSKAVKTNTGRRKINVNGAYNPKTHEIISILQEDNVNTKSNIALFKKVLDANKYKRKVTIVLDNAKMNKNDEIFNFIREQNKTKLKLELLYIPVYSPHLNLIERFWKYAKKKLLANQYYATYSKFKNALIYFMEHKVIGLKSELRTLMTENFQRIAIRGKLQI